VLEGRSIQSLQMSQAFAEIRHFRKCLGNSGNAWGFLNCLGISRNEISMAFIMTMHKIWETAEP